MASRKQRKRARDMVKDHYFQAFFKELEKLGRGFDFEFSAGRSKHTISTKNMVDGWYTVPQETIDAMGKYIHRIVEEELPAHSSNLGEYGSTRPVFLSREVLARIMAEKVVRCMQGRGVLEKVVQDVVMSDELIDAFRSGLEQRLESGSWKRVKESAEGCVSAP